jgi:hypothetical protein
MGFTAILELHSHCALRMDGHRFNSGKPEFFVKLGNQLIMAFQIVKEACYPFSLGGAFQQFIVDFSNAVPSGFGVSI